MLIDVFKEQQEMLVSIVSHFGNTWFLLCLEILHSDCFCCMWYLLCLEVLFHWVSTLLLQKVAAFLLSLHSDWLSGFGE